jgi:threonine synthase
LRIGWLVLVIDARVYLRCPKCGKKYPLDYYKWLCPECGNPLEVVVESETKPSWDRWKLRERGVWRYRELLPPVRKPVSLNEGGTPLIKADRVSEKLWIKFEGANPTGSFKDRGMTIGVSIAAEAGASLVGAASTGNTSASLSAYASRAGMKSIVVLPKGKVALGKLFQAVLHGARIIEINGSFDDALAALMKAADKGIVYPLNSYNPWRLEGQKTIAYEIAEAIGVPDYVFVPVGNAGNISAIWKGFKELESHGLIDRLPRMVGVQAVGASPLATAWKDGREEPVWFENPETVATAIRIGKPVNWYKALRAVKESGGFLISVGDRKILGAQMEIARKVGIGVEPASAASYAGYKLSVDEGLLDNKDSVVLIATGHALKDPGIVELVGKKSLEASSIDEAVKLMSELARG